jgi:hypothetical protein
VESRKQSKRKKRQHDVGSEKKEEASQQKVLRVVILQQARHLEALLGHQLENKNAKRFNDAQSGQVEPEKLGAMSNTNKRKRVKNHRDKCDKVSHEPGKLESLS